MRVASIFTGIGGFELGLRAVGASPVLLCENDPAATRVLKKHFKNIEISGDVKELHELPECDLLVAGWPCQDLSQAGQTSGLKGARSSLIEDVFRLIENSTSPPSYILLENVAFALSLNGGEALKFATERLEAHGYHWAFRILDSNFFGLPQRRRRLFILGSKRELPENVLFDTIEPQNELSPGPTHVGFYWTEGNRGLGWTNNAVPPLKGGSNLSIPSPPAIWDVSTGKFYTPSIQDAERLQGFGENWTLIDDMNSRTSNGQRWRQVGNAVSVNVAQWLGQRITNPEATLIEESLSSGFRGSNAGWGGPSRETRYFRKTLEGPAGSNPAQLSDFGLRQVQPLSERAAKGFYSRYLKGSLKERVEFSSALAEYCENFNSNKISHSRAA